MQLPKSWGLGQAEIHSSLLVSLLLLSAFFFTLSFLRVGFVELRTLAITLPIVWVISLAVRIAAQQLAIGEYSNDMGIVVGPSGNLQTDYEYLPSKIVFAYSAAGQLASLGLISIGLIVGAAMITPAGSELTISELLDLRGGLGSHAWATQIMWVNIFLFAIHLLPTVPFDMRSSVFAFFSSRSPNPQDPSVFRKVAAVDSHLAALMTGIGIASIGFGAVMQQEVLGWYAAAASAVYLFIAGQWELARADELEEQYATIPTPLARLDVSSTVHSPHINFGLETGDDSSDAIDGLTAEAFDSAEQLFDEIEEDYDEEAAPETHDVDEILRKVHKEGTEALSESERQILLSASQELKQRRETRH